MDQRRNDDTNGNSQNNDDNQNNIDDSVHSLSLQQLLDHLNRNDFNPYSRVLHDTFHRQLQGGPALLATPTLQMAGCIFHVRQWYEILHLIFQGLQNDSSDGSVVDGLRLFYSHYLDFHRVASDPAVAHFYTYQTRFGESVPDPVQLTQLDRAVFGRLEDGSLMNSIRRQSSRTNNEVLELSSSSDESSNGPSLRERNVAYTRRQLVSQFNYLESHGHFDRRDRRSRIPFKPLPPGPVRPARMVLSEARMRLSERNMASNTISASSSTRTTSAPHSSVSTNSATHEVGNQFSYVDDSIMSSNSVRSFGGRRNRFAAKYHPKAKPPRPNPDASDEDN